MGNLDRFLPTLVVASLHQSILEILKAPVVLFCLFYMLINFNYVTVVFFLVSILSTLLIAYTMSIFLSISVMEEIKEYIQYSKPKVAAVYNLEEVLDHYNNSDSVSRMLGGGSNKFKCAVIQISNHSLCPEFKAFPMFGRSSLIFLNVDVLKMRAWQLFAFYHELGHTSYPHIRRKLLLPSAIANFFMLLFVVGVVVEWNSSLFMVLFGVATWLWMTHLGYLNFLGTRHAAERLANYFACNSLLHREDLISENERENILHRLQKNDSEFNFDLINAEISDTGEEVNGLYRYWVFNKLSLTSDVIRLWVLFQNCFSPKKEIAFLYFFTIVWSAFFCVDISGSQLIRLSIVMLLPPFLLLMCLRNYAKKFDLYLAFFLSNESTTGESHEKSE